MLARTNLEGGTSEEDVDSQTEEEWPALSLFKASRARGGGSDTDADDEDVGDRVQTRSKRRSKGFRSPTADNKCRVCRNVKSKKQRRRCDACQQITHRSCDANEQKSRGEDDFYMCLVCRRAVTREAEDPLMAQLAQHLRSPPETPVQEETQVRMGDGALTPRQWRIATLEKEREVEKRRAEEKDREIEQLKHAEGTGAPVQVVQEKDYKLRDLPPIPPDYDAAMQWMEMFRELSSSLPENQQLFTLEQYFRRDAKLGQLQKRVQGLRAFGKTPTLQDYADVLKSLKGDGTSFKRIRDFLQSLQQLPGEKVDDYLGRTLSAMQDFLPPDRVLPDDLQGEAKKAFINGFSEFSVSMAVWASKPADIFAAAEQAEEAYPAELMRRRHALKSRPSSAMAPTVSRPEKTGAAKPRQFCWFCSNQGLADDKNFHDERNCARKSRDNSHQNPPRKAAGCDASSSISPSFRHIQTMPVRGCEYCRQHGFLPDERNHHNYADCKFALGIFKCQYHRNQGLPEERNNHNDSRCRAQMQMQFRMMRAASEQTTSDHRSKAEEVMYYDPRSTISDEEDLQRRIQDFNELLTATRQKRDSLGYFLRRLRIGKRENDSAKTRKDGRVSLNTFGEVQATKVGGEGEERPMRAKPDASYGTDDDDYTEYSHRSDDDEDGCLSEDYARWGWDMMTADE